MYIPHPSLFFGEPPTEMKCTHLIRQPKRVNIFRPGDRAPPTSMPASSGDGKGGGRTCAEGDQVPWT
jgi:hypothetical protein